MPADTASIWTWLGYPAAPSHSFVPSAAERIRASSNTSCDQPAGASSKVITAANVGEAVQQDAGKAPQVSHPNKEDPKYHIVTSVVEKALEDDPAVQFMLEELEKAGCPFEKKKLTVHDCDKGVLGGFLPGSDGGLVICYNHYQGSTSEVRNTIVHELVHAYDDCRAKNMDWTNCKHLACSEIRAANLSGDCSMEMEYMRGRVPWIGYQKACVRRRAELSVSMMPHCKLQATSAVLSCMDDCYNDTAPFARAP